MRRDRVDPSVITAAEAAAGSVPGVQHAHARARWTGRTLRMEIEGWADSELPARDADAISRQVAAALAQHLPEAGSLTWISLTGPRLTTSSGQAEPDPRGRVRVRGRGR